MADISLSLYAPLTICVPILSELSRHTTYLVFLFHHHTQPSSPWPAALNNLSSLCTKLIRHIILCTEYNTIGVTKLHAYVGLFQFFFLLGQVSLLANRRSDIRASIMHELYIYILLSARVQNNYACIYMYIHQSCDQKCVHISVLLQV